MSIIKDQKFLQFFWDLAEDNQEKRIESITELISYIKNLENDVNDPDKSVEQYKEYTLKRLFRGLVSPRACARQGFASCLTLFLKSFNTSTFSQLFKILDDNTQVIFYSFLYLSFYFLILLLLFYS